MKTEIFKKIIKEAVKEAFNEEMKGIILEAIKSSSPPSLIKEEKTSIPSKFDVNEINKIMKPSPKIPDDDIIDGDLPEGDFDISLLKTF